MSKAKKFKSDLTEVIKAMSRVAKLLEEEREAQMPDMRKEGSSPVPGGPQKVSREEAQG